MAFRQDLGGGQGTRSALGEVWLISSPPLAGYLHPAPIRITATTSIAFSSKSSSYPFGNYHFSTLSSIVTHCHRSQKFVSNQQADKIPEDEILQYSWLPSPVPAVLTQHIRKQRSTIVYYGEHNLLQGATLHWYMILEAPKHQTADLRYLRFWTCNLRSEANIHQTAVARFHCRIIEGALLYRILQ